MYIFIQSQYPVTLPVTINPSVSCGHVLVNVSFKRSKEQLNTSLQYLKVSMTFIIYVIYTCLLYTILTLCHTCVTLYCISNENSCRVMMNRGGWMPM